MYSKLQPPNSKSSGCEGEVWPATSVGALLHEFISHKILLKSCCKSQFLQKFVDLFFISVIIKNTLTHLCGNGLLQNDLINIFFEMSALLHESGVEMLREILAGFKKKITHKLKEMDQDVTCDQSH